MLIPDCPCSSLKFSLVVRRRRFYGASARVYFFIVFKSSPIRDMRTDGCVREFEIFPDEILALI
jgi:hypothetical protein